MNKAFPIRMQLKKACSKHYPSLTHPPSRIAISGHIPLAVEDDIEKNRLMPRQFDLR